MERPLVEAGVHDKRHEFNALRTCRLDDTRIDMAANPARRVQAKDLRRGDRDLISVSDERPDAPFAVEVPQSLAPLCGGDTGPSERAERREGELEPRSHRGQIMSVARPQRQSLPARAASRE